MPFNYTGIKRITGAGIVDGSIASADLGAGSVTTAKIQNSSILSANINDGAITNAVLAPNAITSAKFAESAVDMSTAKVSGTVPASSGGTGLSALGSTNTTLRVNDAGTGFVYDRTGLVGVKTYIANTTWTKPAGVNRVRVQIIGGGAGGTGHGEAGGAGGYWEGVIDVTSISSVAITIGGGSGGNNYHNACGNAGASSFGPYASASGGEGARQIGGHTGGRPGIGSGSMSNGGAFVSVYGGGGAGHVNHGGGEGGQGFFGGSAIGVHANSPHTYDQEAFAAPGSGGTGGARNHNRGANGRNGMIIVWEYK
jgi:hypothetical protein